THDRPLFLARRRAARARPVQRGRAGSAASRVDGRARRRSGRREWRGECAMKVRKKGEKGVSKKDSCAKKHQRNMKKKSSSYDIVCPSIDLSARKQFHNGNPQKKGIEWIDPDLFSGIECILFKRLWRRFPRSLRDDQSPGGAALTQVIRHEGLLM